MFIRLKSVAGERNNTNTPDLFSETSIYVAHYGTSMHNIMAIVMLIFFSKLPNNICFKIKLQAGRHTKIMFLMIELIKLEVTRHYFRFLPT